MESAKDLDMLSEVEVHEMRTLKYLDKAVEQEDLRRTFAGGAR